MTRLKSTKLHLNKDECSVCELHPCIRKDKCSLSNCSQHQDAIPLSGGSREHPAACGSSHQRKRTFHRMGNLLSQAFYSQGNKQKRYYHPLAKSQAHLAKLLPEMTVSSNKAISETSSTHRSHQAPGLSEAGKEEAVRAEQGPGTPTSPKGTILWRSHSQVTQ